MTPVTPPRRRTVGVIARRRALAFVFVFVFAFVSASCNGPDFPPSSLVTAPRVIAIVAEPPEINPGQLTVLHAITAGTTADSARFRWFVCLRPEASATFTAQSTFGVTSDDEGCFGDAAVQLGTPVEGPEYFFTVPANVLENLEALRAIYGTNLSAASLRLIVATSGIPVTIAMEMTQGNRVVRAIKRVIVSSRVDTNRNPPPPRFRFGTPADGGMGGVHVGTVPGDEETCAADNRAPIVVHTSQVVQVAPETDTASWLQSYDALDSSGNPQHVMETAYYSFFATGGRYDDGRTRLPIQNTVWHAPTAPGPATLWFIVRDGRGGTSGCRYGVTVR